MLVLLLLSISRLINRSGLRISHSKVFSSYREKFKGRPGVQFLQAVKRPGYTAGGTARLLQFLQAVQWPVYSSCRRYNGPCTVPASGTMARVQFLQAVQWHVYSSCRRYKGFAFPFVCVINPWELRLTRTQNHAVGLYNMNVFPSYPP